MNKITITIFLFLIIINNHAQNKPDGIVIKTSIPENPIVSIKNDVYNPDATSLEKKYSPGQNTKSNETPLFKSNYDIDAFQTLIENGNEQYLGHSVVTERTGSTAGTIWVAAGVRSSTSGTDQVRIYRSGGSDWQLKMIIPLGGYLGYEVDAELIEHSSGSKFLWFVVDRQESTFSSKEVYYGIHELGTNNGWYGKLNWPGAGSGDEYYNPRITTDNYDFPDDPWIYVVASLDSMTFDNKHFYAQKFAYITSPYDLGNMQINYRINLLPVYWPNGGTTEYHYLFSDIAYYRLSPTPGNVRLLFTYSNVPDYTKIWMSTCESAGSNAQFLGTIAGHGDYKIGKSALTSPGGGLSSQLMVVFEENYLNSGDWDLVSARSNDVGSTWLLNYIDGSSSTTAKLPNLGTLVSRKGVENEHYLSYALYTLGVSIDSIMSTKSNGGSGTYWDQRVRMDGVYPTTNAYSSVGITKTPDERITVWSSLIGSSNFYLIGSFWPNLPSSVGNETETELNSFQLFQNYPNPFNPTTKISWQSPVGSFQSIKVYDVLGNEVAKLINEYKPAGSYEVEFNASALSSGIYFYKLQAGSFTETKKMIVIK